MSLWRPFETKNNKISHETIEPMTSALTETSPEYKNKDFHVQRQHIILNMYECLKRKNVEMAEPETKDF